MGLSPSPRRFFVSLLTFIVALAGAAGGALAAEPKKPANAASYVVPIDWKRFHPPERLDEDATAGAQLVLRSARFCLQWIASTYSMDDAKGLYVIDIPQDKKTGKFQRHEDAFRPGARAALAVAILLKTGTYDEQVTGVPRDEARRRATRLIKGVAVRHHPHAKGGEGWGDEWQSALWASNLAEAAWILWDDLDDECRREVAAVVEHEADRFIAPGYHVPYWATGDKINSPGDTKAEENAWNSLILQVAVAMAPGHPRAKEWRRAASQLMISAYSLRSDDETNDTVVDGRPVKDWLDGFNMRKDGTVENHGRIHPDYSCSTNATAAAYTLMSLAGRSPPEATSFNSNIVYGAFITREWPSPPYKAPGGTIYRPGEAYVYYPEGTDWSKARVDAFYAFDVRARFFGWDQGLPSNALSWSRVRARHLAEMQSRNTEGRVFAPGEFETYPAPEQNTASTLAEAFLVEWLSACGQLNTKRENWLKE